jgi:hypothetical protein
MKTTLARNLRPPWRVGVVMAPSLLRAVLVAALASAASSGCTSAAPPPADARASEVLLSYKLAPFRLTQDVVLTMKAEMPGTSGDMKLDITGALEVVPIGSKLKLVRSVSAVRRADMSGSLAPTLGEDAPPADVAAKLRAARSAEIVDVRGEVDKAATKTLPDRAPDDSYNGMVAAAVKLPELPDAPLVFGTPVKVAKKATEEIAELPLELTVETTYTLLALDEKTRRATIAIASTSHGARELVAGSPTTVEFSTNIEGTLEFDLAEQRPVSAKYRSSQTVSSNAMPGATITIDIASTFTPG